MTCMSAKLFSRNHPSPTRGYRRTGAPFAGMTTEKENLEKFMDAPKLASSLQDLFADESFYKRNQT